MRALLPLGSVVSIRGHDSLVMICGRLQLDHPTKKVYDYFACDHPLGIVDSAQGLLFNDDAIEKIFYVGFQDIEELSYQQSLMEYIRQQNDDPVI